MELGQRKQLNARDIWKLQPDQQSRVVSASFVKRFDTSRSIPRAIAGSFGWRFVATGIACLIGLVCSLLGSIVLNHVVSSLTSAIYSLEDILMLVVVLFLSQVLQALVENFNSNSLLKKLAGDITNLYTSDCDSIFEMTYCVHQLWILPMRITVVSFMLFNVLHAAAFVGISIIIITFVMNQYVSNRVARMQRVYRSSKDTRMKRVTKTFKAINIVKYNAWEDRFLERIEETSSKELKDVFLCRLNSCASFVLLWGMPVFISIASFGRYTIFLKRELTPAKGGEVVEFASPTELVKKEEGLFFDLMEENGYLEKFCDV